MVAPVVITVADVPTASSATELVVEVGGDVVEAPFPGYVFACKLKNIPLNGGLKCKVERKVRGILR